MVAPTISAELLGGDIHEQIVVGGVRMSDREGLCEILHRRLQLAVAASELFEQEFGEARVRTGDTRVELKLFDVMKHGKLLRRGDASSAAPFRKNRAPAAV